MGPLDTAERIPVLFFPWHLTAGYVLDLLLGDPEGWPHPVRWIGFLVARLERVFYPGSPDAVLQRLAGFFFWAAVVLLTASATIVVLGTAFFVHRWLGHLVTIWLVYSALATRSLHRESARVVDALGRGDLDLARTRLARIVSRDTSALDERDILRAVMETVSENISDGIVAPLFYLALAGPVGGMVYKAVNTMDSMVGYLNDRYRHFGWFAARADDAANWIPARLSGLLLLAAAALLKLDWRSSWRILRRDARKMKSPNAGYPESAAAGALGIRLGGVNLYFGKPVEKPTLGDPIRPLSIDAYRSMIRLLYTASLLALVTALAVQFCFFGTRAGEVFTHLFREMLP